MLEGGGAVHREAAVPVRPIGVVIQVRREISATASKWSKLLGLEKRQAVVDISGVAVTVVMLPRNVVLRLEMGQAVARGIANAEALDEHSEDILDRSCIVVKLLSTKWAELGGVRRVHCRVRKVFCSVALGGVRCLRVVDDDEDLETAETAEPPLTLNEGGRCVEPGDSAVLPDCAKVVADGRTGGKADVVLHESKPAEPAARPLDPLPFAVLANELTNVRDGEDAFGEAFAVL